MAKRYPQNQWNKLKELFREHPYYKLCKTVFDEFQALCPTMVMTPEQLFVDASRTLDSILQTGDISTELCKSLWNDTYNKYREQDGTAGDKNDTKVEVAMLFYMVMYGLTTVNHFHYHGTLQRTLHDCICKFYGREECLKIEKKLREPVNLHTADMLAWMGEYFPSKECLTNDIDLLFHPKNLAGEKVSKKKKETICYTLPYNCPEGNLRVKRLDLVMRLWQTWEWIEEPMTADDFQNFFCGDARNCNLKWTGKLYILTELLKQLLDQHYMDKRTGVSARSIVINQFGRNPSGNKERIDAIVSERIKLTIGILDYKKPIRIPNEGECESNDDLALLAVYAKELHITKDLNRRFD